MKKVDLKKLDDLLKRTGDMSLKRRAKRIVEELDLRMGDKILDLGCGDGFYLHILSSLGKFDLFAVDNNPKAISLAKKYLGKTHSKKVKFFKGDVAKLPYKNSSFDKIIVSELLEHLEDEVQALEEWNRVLKKNGILVMTVPNKNYPFLWDPINWFLERIFKTHIKSGFWSGIWNEHERLYSPGALNKIVKKAGFNVEKIEPLTHYCLPFNHHVLYLGYRARMSSSASKKIKKSMSKFSTKGEKDMFSLLFELITRLDNSNNREFNPQMSSVGIFLKTIKK